MSELAGELCHPFESHSLLPGFSLKKKNHLFHRKCNLSLDVRRNTFVFLEWEVKNE